MMKLETAYKMKLDVAQSGSAPALGAGSREFKSPHPDHQKDYSLLDILSYMIILGIIGTIIIVSIFGI